MTLLARFAAAGLAAVLAAGLAAPTSTSAAGPGAGSGDRRAAYRPTLEASTAQPVAGRWFVLRGTVTPATRGTTVILQKRIGDKRWVDEARVRTTRKGTFRYRDQPHVAGERTYRAIVPAAGGLRRGTSAPVTVTVYKWQSLTKVPVRSSTDTYPDRSGGSLDGVLYAPVFEGVFGETATEGFSDWNLGRRCLALRTTVGNGDAADADTVATITLSGDTTTLYTRSFGLTESEAVTADLTDVFRLGFSWTAPTGRAQAMLAEPEVLCAF